MDNIHQILRILRSIPLFYHFTDNEIRDLCETGKLERVPRGRKLDLKNLNSLVIITGGIFEFESSIKKDVLYLTPGAFFGEKPFIVKKHKGTVKALIDSEILLINLGSIYRFFLSTYKGLKGYIKNIKKLGFEMSGPALEHFGNGSRILTVYSRNSSSGKSAFSSYLGLSLSRHGKVVIVDASSGENSVFSIFDIETAPPISQKAEEGSSSSEFLNESMADIEEGLSVINLSFGAKVRVNPGIISPVLFYLSQKYKYIIIDLSDFDEEFTEKIFSFSDAVFPVLKDSGDMNSYYELFDEKLREGQRVYYILNRFYAETTGSFEGGYILEDFGIGKDESFISGLRRFVGSEEESELINLIIAERRGLVLETSTLDSIFFIPLFYKLSRADTDIDLIYSSSWSFLLASLYSFAERFSEFEKLIKRILSEERITSLLDITFPDRHLYKNGKIQRLAGEILGERRVETYKTVPMLRVMDVKSGEGRMFSTGYFKDTITASFGLYPLFQSIDIGGALYNSDLLISSVKPHDLFRTDIDEIIFARVNNKNKMTFKKEGILDFYTTHIDLINQKNLYEDYDYSADKIINIEVDTTRYDLDEIIETTEERAAGITL